MGLTSRLDFGNRFLDHTWWFVWPVARSGIVNKTYAEHEVFAFADVVIIVIDLRRRSTRECVCYEVTHTLEIGRSVYF